MKTTNNTKKNTSDVTIEFRTSNAKNAVENLTKQLAEFGSDTVDQITTKLTGLRSSVLACRECSEYGLSNTIQWKFSDVVGYEVWSLLFHSNKLEKMADNDYAVETLKNAIEHCKYNLLNGGFRHNSTSAIQNVINTETHLAYCQIHEYCEDRLQTFNYFAKHLEVNQVELERLNAQKEIMVQYMVDYDQVSLLKLIKDIMSEDSASSVSYSKIFACSSKSPKAKLNALVDLMLLQCMKPEHDTAYYSFTDAGRDLLRVFGKQ